MTLRFFGIKPILPRPLARGAAEGAIHRAKLRLSVLASALVFIPPNLGAAQEAFSPPRPLSACDYAARIESELRGNILPFWMTHVRDPERGGFFGYMGNDGIARPEAPRGALLTARILWTYSAAFRRYGDPALLEMAHAALADLRARFLDQENGGLFWMANADGAPLDTRKSTYVQVFGIYGLSEYVRATGDREALQQAIGLFRLVEQHARDPEFGGYHEAFRRDWTPETDPSRSAMELPAPMSQNTHLHVLEAYTNLLRAWPDPEVRTALRSLTGVMLDHVLDAKTHHLRLFLDRDWTPRSTAISFGHDIEASWLLCEAAEVLGDDALTARTRATAVRIAATTLEEGIDADGALLYEAGPQGLTSTIKEWWPQAEAVVGFLNAWQISGDERYLRAAERTWDFIEKHVVDREHGEWFRSVSREGVVNRRLEKVGFWKCPYHNGRACMQAIDRLTGRKAD